jgi:hypothetical protein
MAMIKCPGCSCQFDSNTGLATHKRACKAKITAVASKLLEARKVNLEKKAESKRRRIGENEIGIIEEQLDMDKPDNEEEIWIDEATLILHYSRISFNLVSKTIFSGACLDVILKATKTTSVQKNEINLHSQIIGSSNTRPFE